MTIDDRWNFVNENKICHRCLQKVLHIFEFRYKNKASCTVATRKLKHHTMLHNFNLVPSTNDHTTTMLTISNLREQVTINTTATIVDLSRSHRFWTHWGRGHICAPGRLRL
ncbi:unnamed protein product [Diatraea saccharalis]|uniref:Uncharacterized protein n=1 Tax=Diatraea saccharalis TaxID=40085 RepID=A0A9N9QZR3_9NEOP|nr:unnamed protein product [Diatraea saccharalis]